jgi:short-subunit dehydrogenase
MLRRKKKPAPGTAVITGASAGIGMEMARLAARDGHPLVLVARGTERLLELAAELSEKHGVASTIVTADLADPGSPRRVFEACAEAGADVEVLVNNAGFGAHGSFASTSLRTELDMIQVNVTSVVHLAKLFLPGMVQRGRGRILNVASTAAFQPGPLMSVYYATKAFVLSLSEAVASELSGSGVTVTALCPGPTRSEFQRRADIEGSRLVSGWVKMMEADAVARAGWAAAKRGRRVVIPGFMNKAGVQAIRLSPRRVAAHVVKRLQEKKG